MPINPERLHKHKPLDNFPTMARNNNYETIAMRDQTELNHRSDHLINKLKNMQLFTKNDD